eukprot:7664866-Pyramimonas_sp.AAC.1
MSRQDLRSKRRVLECRVGLWKHALTRYPQIKLRTVVNKLARISHIWRVARGYSEREESP